MFHRYSCLDKFLKAINTLGKTRRPTTKAPGSEINCLSPKNESLGKSLMLLFQYQNSVLRYDYIFGESNIVKISGKFYLKKLFSNNFVLEKLSLSIVSNMLGLIGHPLSDKKLHNKEKSKSVENYFLHVLSTCALLERGQLSKKSDTAEILKKILFQGLRGIKCQNFVFFDIFSETGH